MQSKTALRLALSAASLLFGIGAAVLLYLAFTRSYVETIQHFTLDCPYAVPAVILCAAGCLCALVNGLIFRRSGGGTVGEDRPIAVFASCVLALNGLLVLAFTVIFSAPSGALEWIRMLFLLLASVYYLTALFPAVRGTPLSMLLSLTPAIFGLLSMFTSYFDDNYAQNSPYKSMLLAAWVGAALFFTAEARIALGRVLPFPHLAYGGICLTLSSAVGFCLAMLALLRGGDLLEAVPLLSVCLLSGARLLTFRPAPPDEKKEAPDAAAETADD
jgi:hypothetical protein